MSLEPHLLCTGQHLVHLIQRAHLGLDLELTSLALQTRKAGHLQRTRLAQRKTMQAPRGMLTNR